MRILPMPRRKGLLTCPRVGPFAGHDASSESPKKGIRRRAVVTTGATVYRTTPGGSQVRANHEITKRLPSGFKGGLRIGCYTAPDSVVVPTDLSRIRRRSCGRIFLTKEGNSMHSFQQPVYFLAMLRAVVSPRPATAKAADSKDSTAPLVSRMISYSRQLVVASVAVASLLMASPAFAQFGTNLVVNGGAEEGPGTTDGSAVASIPGWFLNYAPTVVNYANSAGFPTATSPGPVGRGERFFAGGRLNVSLIGQTIDVGFAADVIDSGSAVFDLSAWAGGYYTDNDAAIVQIQFFGENWSSKGTVPLATVDAAARKNVTGMFLRQSSGVIPVGTRQVALTVVFYRTAGVSSDGYVDNIYLSLRNAGE